jgi:acyl-CoA synthetase (AMP-forming)/AMP-acid ligase II
MVFHGDQRGIPARYLLAASERPDADAILFERGDLAGSRLSWSDIANRSEHLAKRYQAAGIGACSRCAVTLHDHPDLVPALVALWRLDSTVVLVDRMWGAALTENVISQSEANFGIDLADAVEVTKIRGAGSFTRELPDGTAMLGYTSGSTGDPKGIPFAHDKLALTMYASAAAATALHGAAPRRIACSARLSGSGTLNMHYTWAVFADAAVVVLPELTARSARDYWARLETHAVDQTYLVPALVELVNQLAADRDAATEAPLCLTGSAPVSARLQRRFHERFGLPLVNCYGISEAMCAIFFGHLDHEGFATNQIGVPPLLQARLVDTAGSVVEGEGEGELELAGPTVFDYYFGNPDATRAAFRGRWLRTGDVLRRDARGIYSIAGRSKDVVMKGGFAIYLNEVEDAALALPDVVEAAGVPLTEGDHEDIGALVRVDAAVAVGPRQIRQLLVDHLGSQRAPCRVVITNDALPRTGQDKLDRRAVLERWKRESGPTAPSGV